LFDKTGTLSEVVELQAEVTLLDPTREEAWVRSAVAGIERLSKHPLAAALSGLSETPARVADFEVKEGQGVSGRVGGQLVRIGQAAWLGVEVSAQASRSVFVEVDGRLTARIDLQEAIAPDSAVALERLQGMGRKVRILSGDPSPTVASVGGVRVEAGLSPAEKVALVREARSGGQRVIFVGDGLNDVAAMAEASLGIAMSSGASLTQNTAAGVLRGGKLDVLPWAVNFCDLLKRRLRGNLVFALTYNLIGITLAASGQLHPVIAALLMVGSSLIVSWRAAHLVGDESDKRR
jgi:P-type E1-E2 ATPase